MNSGELLTSATVWLALAGYAVGTFAFSGSRQLDRRDRVARRAWTLGCIGMLAHTACAFQFYHGWSHTAAYRDTARQTAELFGLHWGGGLYVNYALLAGWVLDCLWWWRGLEAYRRRPRRIVLCWNGFLLFIIFNATVVFETGLARWLGLCLCLGICIRWCYDAKSHSGRVGASCSVPSAGDPPEGPRSQPL
ncbi:MAG: hypothetical protein IIA65_02970 [Planctomycetes bacterium]|nr:hypothetical protein [Planctomycetota bacterium]